MSPARRSVLATGTVEQMNAAFAVELGTYESSTERYRGRSGLVYPPEELAGVIVGVFGLDNRRVGQRNAPGDPPGTTTLTVPKIAELYDLPKHKAHAQTVGILTLGPGYDPADLSHYFATLPPGYAAPAVVDVSILGSVNHPGSPDGETTQDICIAATIAQDATVAVYFTPATQAGWVDFLLRAAFPDAGDPEPSVLSSSWYIANGDDLPTLLAEGVSVAFVNAIDLAFRAAAVRGLTVCIASGDTGSNSKVSGGKAHVQFPGSDQWVVACGGTTVGSVHGAFFEEFAWNDTFFGFDKGATGGGVSDFFAEPHYQHHHHAHVPPSVNDGHHGRGVPDIAANSSPNSGYPMFVRGTPFVANGTSASAPLYAGLFTVLNAALGYRLGFFNPFLYRHAKEICRDISGPPGPTDNSLFGTPGYPCKHGWDACTGWGVIDGKKLLHLLRGEHEEPAAFAELAFSGKVDGIVYDRFSDFDGFSLETDQGRRDFETHERKIEEVVRRARDERVSLTVFVDRDEPDGPHGANGHRHNGNGHVHNGSGRHPRLQPASIVVR